MIRRLAFLVLALTAFLSAQDVPSVMLRGVILDEANEPVPNTKVIGSELTNKILAATLPTAVSDTQGRFELRLYPGKFKLFTENEAAGYPNTMFSFYSNDEYPVVTLNASVAPGEITISLGKKAGVLTGLILDAESGTAIRTATISLQRTDGKQATYGSTVSANYRVLLPTSVSVRVRVSARGYETWESQPDQLIRALPGETVTLDVKLHQKSDR